MCPSVDQRSATSGSDLHHRRLDLDDLCPGVRHEANRKRLGNQRADLQNTDPLERSFLSQELSDVS